MEFFSARPVHISRKLQQKPRDILQAPQPDVSFDQPISDFRKTTYSDDRVRTLTKQFDINSATSNRLLVAAQRTHRNINPIVSDHPFYDDEITAVNDAIERGKVLQSATTFGFGSGLRAHVIPTMPIVHGRQMHTHHLGQNFIGDDYVDHIKQAISNNAPN